mmetsp:Transcript_14363/g.40874  ORF Transcript_14363/g.40874 Transcript_14363/m.40874 type:complete len:183 (-) Transcript_14363:85-633(-)
MPRKFKIQMELTLKESHEGFHTLSKLPKTVGHEAIMLAARSGGTSVTASTQVSEAIKAKKRAKAMSIATKPGQQVMMNAFMMYMSGKQLNIFSISTTSSAIITPITSLIQLDKPFASIDTDTQLPKLIYALLNITWLLVGLYKMSSMRLLPTTSADWADRVVWKEMMESTSIPPTNDGYMFM